MYYDNALFVFIIYLLHVKEYYVDSIHSTVLVEAKRVKSLMFGAFNSTNHAQSFYLPSKYFE